MAEFRRKTSRTETLPIDILTNILSRLPIKCLLRSKSVCKSWFALITSRDFANLHLRLNSLSSDRLLIFSGSDHSLYSVNLDSPESLATKILFPLIWERISRKDIVGSCKGLLLCICDENPNSEALLINPSTLPCKRIPKLQVPENCLYINYGFGYDFEADDYKIVRIVHFISGKTLAWGFMEVMVYSLISNSWKLVDQVFPLHWGTPISQNGVLINNHLLHWIFWCSSLKEHRIACFDLCSEQWSEVPMPNHIETTSSSYYNSEYHMRASSFHLNRKFDMGVLDSCLCLLTLEDGEVWVMKEYGVKDSWAKLLDLSDMDEIGSLEIAPLAYSKEGSKILLRRDGLSSVFWYDLTEKRTSEAEFHGVPDYSQVNICLRSLVSLSCNGRIGGDRQVSEG